MTDTLLIVVLLAGSCVALGILLGIKIRRRAPGRYTGRIVAIGRVADRIPSLDGGHANMTAYTVSMTNEIKGDLSLRIFKRGNPLWEAFEDSGPSDHWIIEARRVKSVKRKVVSMSKLSEGVFHDGKTPAGAWD